MPRPRSSSSVKAVTDSTPSRMLRQSASTFSAPGKRPARPTMATSMPL
jgi:hypothetical protein